MPVPFQYGTFRSHAKGSITWSDLQPTKGAYTGSGADQASMVLSWEAFDTALAEADAKGVTICWNMYRTPAWASRSADQVGGSNTVVGPWGDAGESAVPERLQYLTDIVTAVLQRANVGRRRIAFVEPLNEPEFLDATALASFVSGGGRPYWTGTAAQAVDYAWTVYQATKAVDPSIVVLMPSQYSQSRLEAFLNAVGTVSGKRGWETFDWLNIHPYSATPNQPLGGNDLYYVTSVTTGIAAAKRALRAAGSPDKPLAITEWGLSSQPNAVVTAFNAGTPEYRYRYLTRLFAMAALGGVQMMAPFSYNSSPASNSLAGDYTSDTNGCIAAMTEIHTRLAGQRIVSGGYMPDGSVTVTLENGATYVW